MTNERRPLLAIGTLLLVLGACGGGGDGAVATGGRQATGSTGGDATGGATSTGGAASTGGASATGGRGGSATATGGRGGAPNTGGARTGGAGGNVATGGATGGSGGRPATGGTGGQPATGGAGQGGRNMPGTGGATNTGGATGMTAEAVCARWKADRADMSEGTWNGAVATCEAGDLAPTARANALRLVNLYRWLAALPAVTLNDTLNVKDQACALMMRANNTLNHSPPTTWTCYSQDGADGAGNSNISSGQAVSSVDLYMIDPGNDTTLGHRRWILSNSLGPIGIGGTDRHSCMWTLGGSGKAGKPWMAWPPPGIFPAEALQPGRNQNLDTTGWSLQSDGINLANAQITVTSDGVTLPVTITQLGANYGAKYALRFNPMGWKTTAGKTYAVAVTGVSTAINYEVQVVACN